MFCVRYKIIILKDNDNDLEIANNITETFG